MNLKQFGYAPGNYNPTCSICGDGFMGDKRARVCRSCAEKLYTQSIKKSVLKKSRDLLSVWMNVKLKRSNGENESGAGNPMLTDASSEKYYQRSDCELLTIAEIKAKYPPKSQIIKNDFGIVVIYRDKDGVDVRDYKVEYIRQDISDYTI